MNPGLTPCSLDGKVFLVRREGRAGEVGTVAEDNSRGHGNATNGPYHWGNGPQPKKEGVVAKIVKAVTKGKKGK